jgi:hypothetical protein
VPGSSHPGATVDDVNPLTTLVRSLGNDGAVANARAVLDATAREDWLVQGLVHRLDRAAAPTTVVPATPSIPSAA